MRAIFAIFTFFLFSIGNPIAGYTSDSDLQSDINFSPDQFFELHLQGSDYAVFTKGDSKGKRRHQSAESNVAESNEEELNSSESSGKFNPGTSSGDKPHNLVSGVEGFTASLNKFVRQSTNITSKQPIYLLLEDFRI